MFPGVVQAGRHDPSDPDSPFRKRPPAEFLILKYKIHHFECKTLRYHPFADILARLVLQHLVELVRDLLLHRLELRVVVRPPRAVAVDRVRHPAREDYDLSLPPSQERLRRLEVLCKNITISMQNRTGLEQNPKISIQINIFTVSVGLEHTKPVL